MAKLVLIGEAAHVWLTSDPEDGQIIAMCAKHYMHMFPPGWGAPCGWTERYDCLNDAAEYASGHADGVNGKGWE